MGIRFQCHHCNHQLHVKDFQAGKRGRCPECKGPFRVPPSDSEFSVPIGDSNDAGSLVVQAVGELASSAQSSISVTSSSATASSATASLNEARSPERVLEHSTQMGELRDRAEFGQTQPRVIEESPDATWYVRPSSGGQYGPAPASVVWQWLIEDRIGHDSLVWRDDWPDWHLASQVFSDYFLVGDAASSSVPAATAQPITTQQSTSVPAASTTSIATASSRELRKRSRRKKYTVAIAVLAVILISLAVGLVIVLNQQGILGGSPK